MSTEHIEALKLALKGAANYIDALGGDSRKYRQALAEQPPQRKPLTEDELETAYRAIWRNLPEDFNYAAYGWIEQGIRYAERAHGIGV